MKNLETTVRSKGVEDKALLPAGLTTPRTHPTEDWRRRLLPAEAGPAAASPWLWSQSFQKGKPCRNAWPLSDLEGKTPSTPRPPEEGGELQSAPVRRKATRLVLPLWPRTEAHLPTRPWGVTATRIPHSGKEVSIFSFRMSCHQHVLKVSGICSLKWQFSYYLSTPEASGVQALLQP